MIFYTSFFDIAKQSIKLLYAEIILIACTTLARNVIYQFLLRRLIFLAVTNDYQRMMIQRLKILIKNEFLLSYTGNFINFIFCFRP